jgi:hypothetical protein
MKFCLHLVSQIIELLTDKSQYMKFNGSNNQPKGLNLLQKIGICVLVITIILYYVLSIQFLTS